MSYIMEDYGLKQSLIQRTEGKEYQEAGAYEKALKIYTYAFDFFITTLKMYESTSLSDYSSKYASEVSIEEEIYLLFLLFDLAF